MDHYQRRTADHATTHLSALEHGAYALLLDRYHATESGIPAAMAHRIAKARTPEERDAVDLVLSEFFRLVDGDDGGVWRHVQADEAIAHARGKSAKARESGKLGGLAKQARTDRPAAEQPKPSERQTDAKQSPSERLAIATPESEKAVNRAEIAPADTSASQSDPVKAAAPAKRGTAKAKRIEALAARFVAELGADPVHAQAVAQARDGEITEPVMSRWHADAADFGITTAEAIEIAATAGDKGPWMALQSHKPYVVDAVTAYKARKAAAGLPKLTFAAWRDQLDQRGESAIDLMTEPLHAYAAERAIPRPFLDLAAAVFAAKFVAAEHADTPSPDWCAGFRKFVQKDNADRLWFTGPDGAVALTSRGNAENNAHGVVPVAVLRLPGGAAASGYRRPGESAEQWADRIVAEKEQKEVAELEAYAAGLKRPGQAAANVFEEIFGKPGQDSADVIESTAQEIKGGLFSLPHARGRA